MEIGNFIKNKKFKPKMLNVKREPILYIHIHTHIHTYILYIHTHTCTCTDSLKTFFVSYSVRMSMGIM